MCKNKMAYRWFIPHTIYFCCMFFFIFCVAYLFFVFASSWAVAVADVVIVIVFVVAGLAFCVCAECVLCIFLCIIFYVFSLLGQNGFIRFAFEKLKCYIPPHIIISISIQYLTQHNKYYILKFMSYTHIFLLLHTSSEYFLVFCSQCFKTNSISLTTQHVYCSYIVVCALCNITRLE